MGDKLYMTNFDELGDFIFGPRQGHSAPAREVYDIQATQPPLDPQVSAVPDVNPYALIPTGGTSTTSQTTQTQAGRESMPGYFGTALQCLWFGTEFSFIRSEG